jgi:hypothetical protein
VAPSGFDLHQVLKWRGRFLLTLAVYYKRAIAPFAIASLLGLAGPSGNPNVLFGRAVNRIATLRVLLIVTLELLR